MNYDRQISVIVTRGSPLTSKIVWHYQGKITNGAVLASLGGKV